MLKTTFTVSVPPRSKTFKRSSDSEHLWLCSPETQPFYKINVKKTEVLFQPAPEQAHNIEGPKQCTQFFQLRQYPLKDPTSTSSCQLHLWTTARESINILTKGVHILTPKSGCTRLL